MNEPRRRSTPPVLAVASEAERPGKKSCARGFTLIELLVVIAIVAMLGATLLPALAASKASTKASQCLSNTHQLVLGWAMYASDHRGQLISSQSWVGGLEDWTSNPDNTNTALLVGGGSNNLMAQYIKSPHVYKCPADIYQSPANPGPRVRSYSMNGALGNTSGPVVQGTAPDGRKYYGSGGELNVNALRTVDLIHPSAVFVTLDEQAASINDGKFMFNPGAGLGQPSPEHWRDLPAGYHDKSGCFSFADGHSVIHRWQDPRTIYPVTFDSYIPWKSVILVVSPDYEWMDDHMPYR